MNEVFYCIDIYNIETTEKKVKYIGNVYPIREINGYTLIKVSESQIKNLSYSLQPYGNRKQ